MLDKLAHPVGLSDVPELNRMPLSALVDYGFYDDYYGGDDDDYDDVDGAGSGGNGRRRR